MNGDPKAIIDRKSLASSYLTSHFLFVINKKRFIREHNEVSKAIEHYEEFLHLWKDADPGVAEVEDAEKRLVGLND